MRFVRRILLLAVVGCALAGGWATSAKAIAFNDQPCRPDVVSPTIHFCPSGEVGKSYSLEITAHGGCDVYVWSNPGGGMPPGLTLGSAGLISATGPISGIPTTPGKYIFWLQIQDTIGVPASWCTDDKASQREFEIDILPGLQIQQRQSVLAPAQVNIPYSLTFTTTGATGVTWSVSSGALPAGLSLNKDTGVLSGTPTQTGDAHIQIKASSGTRSDVQTYTLPIVEPLRIAKPAAVAEVGLDFKLPLAATGRRAEDVDCEAARGSSHQCTHGRHQRYAAARRHREDHGRGDRQARRRVDRGLQAQGRRRGSPPLAAAIRISQSASV